jgi:hypothetical protein
VTFELLTFPFANNIINTTTNTNANVHKTINANIDLTFKLATNTNTIHHNTNIKLTMSTPPRVCDIAGGRQEAASPKYRMGEEAPCACPPALNMKSFFLLE